MGNLNIARIGRCNVKTTKLGVQTFNGLTKFTNISISCGGIGGGISLISRSSSGCTSNVSCSGGISINLRSIISVIRYLNIREIRTQTNVSDIFLSSVFGKNCFNFIRGLVLILSSISGCCNGGNRSGINTRGGGNNTVYLRLGLDSGRGGIEIRVTRRSNISSIGRRSENIILKRGRG